MSILKICCSSALEYRFDASFIALNASMNFTALAELRKKFEYIVTKKRAIKTRFFLATKTFVEFFLEELYKVSKVSCNLLLMKKLRVNNGNLVQNRINKVIMSFQYGLYTESSKDT